VSQLEDVGRPILLPLERAKVFGRHADPVSAGGCRRYLEQTGFQACLSFRSLTSILAVLFLVALCRLPSILRGLLHLHLEKLH
jgi:hypothetical protein